MTFTFAPPVDRGYELRAYGTGTIKWGGNREVVEAGLLARRTFTRAGVGYRLAEVTRDVALAMDGERLESKLLDQLKRNRLTYVIGADGAFQRLEGARENLERMVPLLEGESKKSAEKRLAEGRFGDAERADWYATYEILAGQKLELDRDYWFHHAHPTDDGWAPHDVLFRVGPWDETPNGRLLRQRVAYVRSALLEIPGAVELTPRVRSRFDPAAPGPRASGYQITGNVSRLIDPATLTIWREQLYRREAHEIRPVEEVGITFVVEARLDFTLTPAAD